MKPITRYTPEFILLIYIGLFIGLKQPTQQWDRVINSDGKGYYAYLPAIFIYHDLDFNFLEEYESVYYPPDKSVFKEFRTDIDSRIVNKYFAGLAILWLPFFLLGHLITLISGLPADGYSIIYQYAIAVANLFYLWAGCRALFVLLKKLNTWSPLASFITLAIAFGTNMVFYAIVEPSMSHIYSFALVVFFLLSGINFFRTLEKRWLFILAAV